MKKREPAVAGQESVWDYPRPPRVEPSSKPVRVVFNGEVIADSTSALRVLETSHPPTYYLPPEDVRTELLTANRQRSICEFKGQADYLDIELGGNVVRNGAWRYANPAPGYEELTDHIAFYPSRVEACFVGEERVQPQAGDFYGGWITSDIVGPFKGGPGTRGW